VLERVSEHMEEVFFRERYLLAAARDGRPLTEDNALFAGVVED
jgi:hypothetical protein